MNNSSNDSIPVKIFNFIAGSVIAFIMGLWLMAGLAVSTIFPLFKLGTNLRILGQAHPDNVNQVTSDRATYVSALGLIAAGTAGVATTLLTRADVAVPLVAVALAGLGFVFIRGIELAGSSANQYTKAHKIIGNVSGGIIAAIAAAIIAPVLSPAVLTASVATGWLLAFNFTLRQIPTFIKLPSAVGPGLAFAYCLGGPLAALVVLLGAAIQLDTISSALETLAQSPNSELNKTRATNNYTLGFTLLQTTIVAVVLSGISLLIR